MISVGLVGCGAVVHEMYAKALIGRFHYAVRYVYDLDTEQASSAAQLFGAESIGLDDLAERSDAVLVTTPPSSHASLVRKCLRPGRVILCEKPYMTSYRDACAVFEESRNAGARLYVDQFRRVFPQLELARRLVSLGLIGDVTRITASEGGRFTWHAVSNYTTRDPSGGVLWDTGAHTLDMALFAAGLDEDPGLVASDVQVVKDKQEPSHDFAADFTVSAGEQSIRAHLHVSRMETLPNVVRIVGTRGSLALVTGMDDRVRLTTAEGSTILLADRTHVDLMECFDLMLRRVLLSKDAEIFNAERSLGQVRLLEALADV